MSIAVTGAAGQLGRHAVAALIAKGVAPQDIIAIVRDEAKAADLAAQGVTVKAAPYDDVASLQAALQGVDKLLFISASEIGKRAAQHANIIEAAKQAGVGFIAYTSLLKADTSELSLAVDHRATEALLADSAIDHAVLRNGWYWENYASQVDPAKATGHVYGAAGAGLVSGAARKDYAEAAAAVLTSEGHAGHVYELAGAPTLDYPGIAAAIGDVIGAPVTYVNQSEAEYAATLEAAGTPGPVAEFVAGMDTAIAGGALESNSTDLADLIGRATTGAVEALSAH